MIKFAEKVQLKFRSGLQKIRFHLLNLICNEAYFENIKFLSIEFIRKSSLSDIVEEIHKFFNNADFSLI